MSKLNEYGIILLTGEINPEVMEKTCTSILEMNLNRNLNGIRLIIDSPGGYATSGFSIIELLYWSKLPVYTYALGLIASMSLLIFMAGEKGSRVITPTTQILSHKYSGGKFGTHTDLVANRKHEDMLYEMMIEHYKRHTHLKSKKKIEDFLLKNADEWLSPAEAIKYGIADKIEKHFVAPTISKKKQ